MTNYKTGDYLKIDPRIKVFGELTKGDCPSENEESLTFVNQIRKHHPRTTLFHIKNEGKRTKAQMDADMAMGFIKGVSDYCLVGNPVGFAEMKRTNYSHKVSKEQEKFLIGVIESGGLGVVTLGHKGALEFHQYWLAMQSSMK